MDLPTSLHVHGANGALTPFSRDKLFVSVYNSCGHRKAAVSDATALTATILSKLLKTTSTAQISKAKIRTTALEILENFDSAAAVHYAAYHKP